jgi:hypothetical protein
MVVRAPLGDIAVNNAVDTTGAPVKRSDDKMKRAMLDVLEERRKRAEADGTAQSATQERDIARDEAAKHQAEVS